MQTTNPRLLESAVDWLTVTCNDRKAGKRMVTRAGTIIASEARQGNDKSPAKVSGFAGFKAGGIFIGELNDWLMVRLSSDVAASEWKHFHSLATNTTRIDLQCTVAYADDVAGSIGTMYQDARAYVQGKARLPGVSLYTGADESQTCYVGSRMSERFGRIYDKGKESKLDYYQNAVRFEAEYKGDVASRMAARLSESKTPERYIAAQCARMFANVGVDWPIPPESCEHICSPRKRTDIDRRLTFLAQSCKSCVAACIAAGRLDDVLSALGLSEYVRPVVKRRKPSERKPQRGDDTQ